ncbi:MAG: bifunctional tetrahydrofolate synthase/dihydrofolate synthase [Aquimonas sp.]|nr:bifunctional tetrahydrofolate synthase/dihydrofolate synthase [Aquimonas sp.]
MDLQTWLERLLQLHPKDIELGLDRVRPVAETLGVLRPARRVVTVAGTNGKGSTVAMLESAAVAAGWKVGAYTSPHLQRYNERVRVQGVEASDAELVEAFEAVDAARGEVPLTYFEFGTLAALWLFRRTRLDLVVLEVGMGGRLDAVNLVDADIAILTTVDLDHQHWLGPDREAIGREKAGIFRPGRPALIGEREPPASVLEFAAGLGARLERRGFHFDLRDRGARLRYHDVQGELEMPRPLLAAPAQLDNAAVAVRALRLLRMPAAAIARGVASAAPAGRLQRLPGVPEVVLDVAHNPQATAQLAAWLDIQGGSTRAVFAALADKDVQGIASELEGRIAGWHLAGLDGPRGQSCEALAERVRAALPDAVPSLHADVPSALEAALSAAAETGQRVLVFGSFQTVGAALAVLGRIGRVLGP